MWTEENTCKLRAFTTLETVEGDSGRCYARRFLTPEVKEPAAAWSIK